MSLNCAKNQAQAEAWDFPYTKPGLSLAQTPSLVRANLRILERILEEHATFLLETRHLSPTLD